MLYLKIMVWFEFSLLAAQAKNVLILLKTWKIYWKNLLLILNNKLALRYKGKVG